jgi:hypothetical protein
LVDLENCRGSGNFNTSVPAIQVNEVSTVVAAYAMAGFATDATHVSSSGTSLARTGIANAFANAANLASISTGAALATTPGGHGTVPQSTINTVVAILHHAPDEYHLRRIHWNYADRYGDCRDQHGARSSQQHHRTIFLGRDRSAFQCQSLDPA